ncbi:MAG: UbiA family prenyltransferase, partial [Gemmatimonadaceae bacterium]
AAATGSLAPLPLLLFALVFLWTPPHFWALALFVKTDYANAGIPMLPVVAGERMTRTQIGLYTIPMAVAAVAPWPLGLTGAIYGWVAVVATAWFALLAALVMSRTTGADDRMRPEKRLFAYSIAYLFILFGAVVADRWLA